jgi:hypothetical protein
MTWQKAIERWRSLPRAEQSRLRRARIPRNVAESMAFEGEPVELAAMEAELERLATPLDTSRLASGS